MAKISQIKSAHLQPDHQFLARHVQHAPITSDTDNISEYDNDTPFPPDADVSSFRGNGIG